MLNKIWPAMIIISVIFGILNGRIEEVNNSIFVSFEDTVEMGINFLGIMCFWSGMIKILKNTKILGKIQKILKPFIDKFFGNENKKVKELISLNMVSNMLGIGNAATPIGIETMKEMEKESSGTYLTYGMNMFVLLNTLSIQIMPTTIISIRASLESQKAGSIIIPVWITSIVTFFSVMLVGAKLFRKEKNYENI